MDALSIDIYDEERRAKIEALQWKIARDLLKLGLTVVIDGAPGEGPSGTPCGWEPERLVPRLSCIISLHRWTFSSTESDAGAWRSRPLNEMR
jgi:hypothetical protein